MTDYVGKEKNITAESIGCSVETCHNHYKFEKCVNQNQTDLSCGVRAMSNNIVMCRSCKDVEIVQTACLQTYKRYSWGLFCKDLCWCSCFLEFLFTGPILFFIVTMAELTMESDPAIQVALVSAVALFAFYVGIESTKCYSGAHFNPTVSIAEWLYCNISWLTALCHIVAQFLSICVWGLIARLLFGNEYCLALPSPQDPFSQFDAFFLETVGVTALLIVIQLSKDCSTNAGWVIASTLALGHLILITISGASLNPYRYLFSALFSGCWESCCWIYFVSHLLALVFAWVFHWFILCCKAKYGVSEDKKGQ